jgi:predicted RNA-binding protein YlqC (UPF0109 family)
MEDLKEIVSFIAKALVDDPEEVEVEVIEGEKTVIVELSVAPTDLGKVIGKDGRTAQSIRTLLNAAASKAGRLAHLDIVD